MASPRVYFPASSPRSFAPTTPTSQLLGDSSIAQGSGGGSSVGLEELQDAYLSELLSYSLDRLNKEPELLRADAERVQRQMQEVAVAHYRAFITAADAIRSIHREINSVDQHLGSLVSEIPKLTTGCNEFLEEAQGVMEKRRLNKTMLATHPTLMDLLEIPQLMDTCVRNGNYDEALDLEAFVAKLTTMHARLPVIQQLAVEVRHTTQAMLSQLLLRLRSNIQLPECLRVIGYLRRLAVFSETEMRLQFLRCREAWLGEVVSELDPASPYDYLKRLTDCHRVHLFDVATQYHAIFAHHSSTSPDSSNLDEDSAALAALLGDGGVGGGAGGGVGGVLGKYGKGRAGGGAVLNGWGGGGSGGDGGLVYGWAMHRVAVYLAVLAQHLPRIEDGGSLASVLEHCMYCGMSLGRVGLDLRGLLPPLFESCVLRMFQRNISFAVDSFHHVLETHRWVPLPSMGSAARMGLGGESLDDVAPPYSLMEHPPLAAFVNGILAALNELRHCAPTAPKQQLAREVERALAVVAGSLGRYSHTHIVKDSEAALFISTCRAFVEVVCPYVAVCVSRCYGSPATLVSTQAACEPVKQLILASMPPAAAADADADAAGVDEGQEGEEAAEGRRGDGEAGEGEGGQGEEQVGEAILPEAEEVPHLRELDFCVNADFVHIENKYGTFICEPHLSFPNQVFPSNPSDAPPGGYRQNGGEEEPEDPYVGDRSMDEHYGGSTIMAYDPLFNWDSERAAVIGHRLPIRPITSSSVGTRFSVRILGLTVQAGLVEPVSGTMCLYHAERREKASEDFHFQFLPAQWEGESTSPDSRAIFSVDKESAALCLLVQLDKAASEESVNGIKPAVYTRKDPPTLTDKEAARLSEWAQVMPFREPLAWITIPLFDSSVTGGVGGFGASGGGSSGGGSSGSLGGGGGVLGVEGGGMGGGAGSSPVVDSNGVRVPAYELGGPPVQIDIPTLNRAKECYTDDQLLDPKKKAQKPVRVSMHFEVERLPGGAAAGAAAGGSVTPRSLSSSASQRGVNQARSQDSMTSDMDDVNMVPRSLSVSRFLTGFQAIDFTDMVRAEPFTRLVHLLFVYPQQVALPKKLNLFVRTELRADDLDIQRPSVEAIFPKERNGPMLRTASTQVVQGARPALFHDEVKMQLPASVSPAHHLLFTFFHIDLSLRSERPKPVAVGYAVMPLAAALQAFKAEVNLPISKDLQPRYLQESTKSRLTYWEEGRPIFRVRTRLFSSLLPLSDRLRDFFHQFDRHMLEAPLPREDLLEAINALKTVDVVVLMQFLYPLLNMLLCMIGNGVETLQVAAFRAMVNIVSRVQLELAPQAGAAPMERSRFLVHFVDFIFDDLGRNQPPVYPGLSNVWRSLARSKSRGFRVGPVYAEALQMAWFVLELIVKSMDLELAQVPQGDEIARLRLEDEVFLCIRQLFECLLAEVHEKAVSDPPLAKSLSSSISFFCYDLISVVDPPQVFELVGLFLSQFVGVCPPMQHMFKLHFLRIVCDHDLYIETPGRGPTEKNYLTTVLLKDLFVSLDHEDPSQRSLAARMLAFQVAKHEYDARYQQPELKLYIAQLYMPIVNMILDEVETFHTLGVIQRRQILVVMLTVVRNLDNETLLKAWKQSDVRTRLFFTLLQQALVLFQHPPQLTAGSKPRPTATKSSPATSAPADATLAVEPPPIPMYSDRVSLATNDQLDEMARADPKALLEREQIIRKVTGSAVSGGKGSAVSLRDVLARSRIPPKDAMALMRQNLPPSASGKLLTWEASVAAWCAVQVLEVVEKFSDMAADGLVATDYQTMDCLTGPLSVMLALPQPMSFWEPLVPAFAEMLRLHGKAMLDGPPSAAAADTADSAGAAAKGGDVLLKGLFGSLLKQMALRPEFIRKRALLCLLLLLRNALLHMKDVERLRVILTVALSEVLSHMRLLHAPSPSPAPASRSSSASSIASAAGGAGGGAGELVESAEVEKLRLSLEELGTEDKWFQLLDECGLPSICLEIVVEEDEEKEEEEDEEDEEEEYEEWDEGGSVMVGRRRKRERDRWTWSNVEETQDMLLTVVDAASQHEQLMEGLKTSNDKYAIVESYYILAQAYGHVPDLYIMWMLHLCDAHQEMNQWAEAAQCAVSVAGIVIRGLQIASEEPVWDEEHLEVLWSICPLARHQWRARAFSSQSGFGAAWVTVEGAVQHVQRASNLFYKAELFHFCALMLSLLLPLHRTRHDYKQLTKTHNKIASIYENVEQQETSPIPFKDACYYRVGFYGERFRYIDGREFIYREPRDVRLGDIMEKLKALYDARSPDEEPLQIIQDSRQVDPAALKPNLVYMQITAVEPVVGAGEGRWLGRPLEPPIAGTPTFSCFFFDTPFTPNGKQQGRMEDQWKRRTLLYTQSTLPSLISRQPVVRSEVREYSPIQCAVEIIESRSFALEAEMASQLGDSGAAGAAGGPAGKKDPAAVVAAAMAAGSGPLQLPRLQTLQRLLQGSVALQVNSGVLGVCMAFYQANPQGANPRAKDPEKLQPSELEMLTSAIVRFVVVCKRAVVVHGRAVTEEDRDFQEQLEQSLEDLEKEISAFIPGLRKRASAY
ncbi:unnamed protein product [Closterium sp. Naga37s-1]|nr:unnamed protein product [Closterium sp. Naga37s-1]